MSFELSAFVAADPEVVPRLAHDDSRRPAWDPFLRHGRALGGATVPARGVRAWPVEPAGVGMETEDVPYRPPRVVAMRMPRGLKTFVGARGGSRAP